MRKKSLFFMVAVLTACLVGSTWAQTTIEAVNEHWLRETAPDTIYDSDGVTVWSTSKGDRRYGIIEFDLSSFAGEPIIRATLELYSAIHAYSDYGTPIIQTAYVFDSTTGTGFTDLTWNNFMAEKDAGKVPLETLGAYDLPAASGDEAQQDAFVASEASGADLALIQAAVDAGGSFCIVMVADESGAYGQSWGDGEAAWSGEAPRLVITAPTGPAYNPDPVPGQEFVAPDAVLSWEVDLSLYAETPSYEVYISVIQDSNFPGVIPETPSTTSFDPEPDLENDTTYYWRVDVTDPNFGKPLVYTGDVWSFTTAPERVIASNPTPDGTTVDPSATLIWDSDINAVANEVYLRQPNSFDNAWYLIKTLTTSGPGTSYTPSDDMEIRWDERYEWRIDTVFDGPAETLTGDVWTFDTTTPVCNDGERLPGDENGDCLVTLADLAVTASNWLVCGWEPEASCGTWPYPPTASTIITTHMEVWIRSLAPTATYEDDGGGVYSSATGGVRATLVEFDLSAVEGKTLTGARLFAYNLGGWSGNDDPCKSHAFVIDPNQTPASSSTWDTYQAEYAGTEVALDLGEFDMPAGAPSAYFGSTFATLEDLVLIEAETIANGGDGILTLVLIADEDGNRYRFDIGDDAYYGDRMYLEFLTE